MGGATDVVGPTVDNGTGAGDIFVCFIALWGDMNCVGVEAPEDARLFDFCVSSCSLNTCDFAFAMAKLVLTDSVSLLAFITAFNWASSSSSACFSCNASACFSRVTRSSSA